MNLSPLPARPFLPCQSQGWGLETPGALPGTPPHHLQLGTFTGEEAHGSLSGAACASGQAAPPEISTEALRRPGSLGWGLYLATDRHWVPSSPVRAAQRPERQSPAQPMRPTGRGRGSRPPNFGRPLGRSSKQISPRSPTLLSQAWRRPGLSLIPGTDVHLGSSSVLTGSSHCACGWVPDQALRQTGGRDSGLCRRTDCWDKSLPAGFLQQKPGAVE